MNADVPGGGAPPEPPPGNEPVGPPPVHQPATPVTPAQPLTDSEARTWAMLSHLSVLLNLVTGFLGVIVPLIIYLIYKDRSRYVAYQSMQAFVFQLIWWGGGGLIIGVIWAITGVLSAIVIGLLCVPFALIATLVLALMPLVALVYGVYAALETNQGKDFRYWLVGDWLRGMA
jgi:uncharacterized Tic20 family protein